MDIVDVGNVVENIHVSFLFVNTQQGTVCFIRRLRQAVQRPSKYSQEVCDAACQPIRRPKKTYETMPGLVMRRSLECRQRLEPQSNIYLRPTT